MYHWVICEGMKNGEEKIREILNNEVIWLGGEEMSDFGWARVFSP